MSVRHGSGHYRNLAKRGILHTSPASPIMSRHKIHSPLGIVQDRVHHSIRSANLADRPNSIRTLNPGRK